MAYDPLAESLRMLAEGVPDVPFRLTRRRRFIPAAYDIDDDAAATLFLRRGVSGEPWLESWVLTKQDGAWALLGGGAGSGFADVFHPRPARAELGRVARIYGGGSTDRNADRLMPWGARWVHTREMRLVSEVATLRVADRAITVPPHGLAIVVWTSKQPPLASARSASGEPLGSVDLSGRW